MKKWRDGENEEKEERVVWGTEKTFKGRKEGLEKKEKEKVNINPPLSIFFER